MRARALLAPLLLSMCGKPNPPPPRAALEDVVDAGLPELDAAADADASVCGPDDWFGTVAQWFVVRDRKVARTDGAAITTYEPGVYPMLWVQSSTIKMYVRYWLPAANQPKGVPRAVTFTSCAPASLPAPVPSSLRTLTAIRCEGRTPMLFAATEKTDGTLSVVEAVAASSPLAWSNVAGDEKVSLHASCVRLQTPAISAEPYHRDVVGPGTFP